MGWAHLSRTRRVIATLVVTGGRVGAVRLADGVPIGARPRAPAGLDGLPRRGHAQHESRWARDVPVGTGGRAHLLRLVGGGRQKGLERGGPPCWCGIRPVDDTRPFGLRSPTSPSAPEGLAGAARGPFRTHPSLLHGIRPLVRGDEDPCGCAHAVRPVRRSEVEVEDARRPDRRDRRGCHRRARPVGTRHGVQRIGHGAQPRADPATPAEPGHCRAPSGRRRASASRWPARDRGRRGGSPSTHTARRR